VDPGAQHLAERPESADRGCRSARCSHSGIVERIAARAPLLAAPETAETMRPPLLCCLAGRLADILPDDMNAQANLSLRIQRILISAGIIITGGSG
jgi:hypothetical protein